MTSLKFLHRDQPLKFKLRSLTIMSELSHTRLHEVINTFIHFILNLLTPSHIHSNAYKHHDHGPLLFCYQMPYLIVALHEQLEIPV